MKRLSIPFAFAFIVSCAAALAEAQVEQPNAKAISLDQIWAFKMPGTRDVRELEPKPDTKSMTTMDQVEDYFRGSSVHQILRVLSNRPTKKSYYPAGPVFAVAGTGKEALKNAQAVFATLESKYPDPRLAADTEVSLVFYSYSTGRYVQLVSVEQAARTITINYRLVQHMSCDMSTHFALIPVGELPAGRVQVKVSELPMVGQEGQHVTWTGARSERVCNGSLLIIQ